VVPEILEPSLQLAAAVLGSLNLTSEEINDVIDSFRRNHMRELRQLSQLSGGSLGYGLSRKDDDKVLNVEPNEIRDAEEVGVIKVQPAALPGAA
jgi:hypothetical protein